VGGVRDGGEEGLRERGGGGKGDIKEEGEGGISTH